jgi:hypothetical protein
MFNFMTRKPVSLETLTMSSETVTGALVDGAENQPKK